MCKKVLSIILVMGMLLCSFGSVWAGSYGTGGIAGPAKSTVDPVLLVGILNSKMLTIILYQPTSFRAPGDRVKAITENINRLRGLLVSPNVDMGKFLRIYNETWNMLMKTSKGINLE
jgi:hypothetical protein